MSTPKDYFDKFKLDLEEDFKNVTLKIKNCSDSLDSEKLNIIEFNDKLKDCTYNDIVEFKDKWFLLTDKHLIGTYYFNLAGLLTIQKLTEINNYHNEIISSYYN